MPARCEEKVSWLEGQIWSREQWLETHGSTGKWPSTDIESKRYGLGIMTDIKNDYERSLEAAKRRQEAAE